MSAQGQVVRRLRLENVAIVLTLVAALLLSMLGLAPAASAEALSAPALTGTIDPDNPRLQWNPVVGATKYKVELSPNADYSTPYYSVTTDNLQATPYKDAPVGTTYYRVRAVDSTNTNGAPAEGSFLRTIQPVVDGIDQSPTVTPGDGDTVDYPAPVVLRWPWVARMYTYTVQVDDNASFTSPTIYANVQGTSLALQTTPAFGTSQYWRVKGVSDIGAETSWSGPWSFIQDWPTSDAVPTNLLPANDLDGTKPLNDVRLSWSPVTGAEKYEVQVSLSSDFNDLSRSIFNGTVVSASWAPRPTLAVASYFWRVRAVAVGDRKLTSGWTATRQFRRSWGPEEGNPTPPVSPDDATARAYPVPQGTSSTGVVARDDFKLEWAPVKRAGAYVVQISTHKNFPVPVPSDGQTMTCTTYRTSLTLNRSGNGIENTPFPVTAVGTNTNTLTGSISCDAIDPASPSTTAGITDGRVYYWRVMAVDTSSTARPANDPNIVMTPWSSAQEDPSNPPSFQVDSRLHATPTSGTAVDLISPANNALVPDAPELTWSPVTGYGLYRVQTALASGFENVQSTQYTTSTRLTPAGSMRDNDTSGSYYWRVQACTAQGNCEPTTEVLQFKKRNKIVDQHPVDMTTDEVRFSWDTLSQTPGSAGVVRGYRIDVSTNPDFSSTSAIVESATVDVPFHSAPSKYFGVGQYYWRVVPIDDALRELASTPTNLDNLDETWKFTVVTTAPTAEEPAVGPPITVVPAAPTLTWSPSKFVTGYQVEIYKGGNLSGVIEHSSGTVASAAYTPSTKKFVPGLYSWRVRKIGPGSALGSWNTDTLGSPPTFLVGSGKPAVLQPADGAPVDPNQRLLRWEPVRGAVSYRVLLTGPGVSETTVTAYTQQAPIAVLTAGSTYSWTVSAVNSGGDVLAESPSRSFTVRTVPSAPRTPAASAVGTTLNVSWTAPANDGGSILTRYTVRYRVFGSSSAWTVLDRDASTGSVAVLPLPTSTKYEAQIAAVNVLGQSLWSGLVSATTATTPSTPTNLKVTAGVGTLTVSWSKPADGGSPITSYVLRYTPAGGSTTTVNTAATSVTLAGLASSIAYSLDVAAVNAVGTGSFATAVQGSPTSGVTPTPTPAPSTPTPPRTTAPSAPSKATAVRGNTRVTVSWSAPTSNGGTAVTGYTVTSTPGGKTCFTASLSCVVTGLANGTSYTFVVKATNAVGAGAASSASPAVVPATRPGVVRSLKAKFPKARKAVVSWTAPASGGGSAVTRYQYRVSIKGKKWTGWISTNKVRKATILGQRKGKRLLLEARAVNALGAGTAKRLTVRPTR